MNGLTVTDGIVAYWQRVELPDGVVGTKNTTITLKDDVSLLRNIAKITVKNLSNEPVTGNYLTNVSFAIGGYIDRGTVAPYSASSGHFTKGVVTEALNGNIVSIVDEENEFVSAQNGSGGNLSEAQNIYERKNSVARNQTYIIIKAYFQDTPAVTNTTRPSYYKIDFVSNRTATELLDIERNYHYIIHINDVIIGRNIRCPGRYHTIRVSKYSSVHNFHRFVLHKCDCHFAIIDHTSLDVIVRVPYLKILI